MQRTLRICTLTLLAATAVAGPALSQSATARNCAMREKIVASLADKYGESRQSIGLGARNQVIETWASAETGTWTITVTHPNGLTCLMASGQAFEALDEHLAPGEDA